MSSSHNLPELVPILERARQFGFLGQEPVVNHIDHARRYCVPEVASSSRALDLGSGGGLPGLVLALHYPAISWVLMDAMAKRCAFLRGAVDELGLGDRVSVAEGRAEELGRLPQLRSSFDVVTARSFGAPAVLAECASPFLKVGGHIVVSEPPAGDIRWPTDGLGELGLQKVSEKGSPVAVLRQVTLCSDRFPRRVGVPAKRPLF